MIEDAEFALTLTGEVFTPPVGDFCADPLPIPELPFSTTGTTTDNTDSYANPSPDEWYDLTLAESGYVYITLCGAETDYDTYLRLLTTDCVTELAYDDDGPECPDDQSNYEPSELYEFLVAGDYRICVEGYSNNSGNYYMEVSFEPFEPGQGDFCDDPWPVEALPYETTGTTSDNIDTWGYDSPDEWYQFSVDHEGLYTISLCGSSFNTYLYLLGENCATVLSVNDNDCDLQSRLTLPLDPGTYHICIEASWSGEGAYELEIAEVICEPLDCVGTPESENNDGCYDMSMEFQPISDGETICGELWANVNDRDTDWYVFDLDDFYTLTATVASYHCDPYLYLVSDPNQNCGYTTITSVNNGTICEEEELVAIPGPGHYYLYLMHDQYELAEGEYELTIQLEPYEPPPGDYCEESFPIDVLPYSTTGTTVDNIDTYGNPSPDEWYALTLEESGNTLISMCAGGTDFDSYLRLLSDDCVTELASNDDACGLVSELFLYLEAGDYRICVEGYWNYSGNYSLDVTHDPFTPGVGDFCDDPHIVEELPYETTASNLDNINTYGMDTPDEWYRFEILEEGLVTISLCVGTTFDSYIHLLMEDCFTVVATDNYGCSGNWGDPSFLMRLLQPGTYLLCVEGNWGDPGGDYTLSIEWEEFDPPPGEYCTSAIQIPMLPYEGSETTSDNLDTYGNPSPDEWYEFSLPIEGNVYIGLCQTGWDTYLHLLSDDCVNELFSNDDSCSLQSELDVFLEPGTYKICVEGFSSNHGDYILEVSTDVPSQGNSCLDPFLIESFPFSDEWWTYGYGDTGFEPSPDVYYEFLLVEEGVYSFTTCMAETYENYFDTRLLILAEDCETIVYANDDACDQAYANWSTITTCLAQGLYYLVIEGYGTASGSYILECDYVGECDPCNPPECPDWGIDEVEPNNGANGNPPGYDNIAFGETHCGNVWSSAYTRDSDWYQFEVAADTHVEFLLDGEEGHSLALYIIDENSGAPEIIATGFAQGYCADYLVTHTIAAAGVYSVYVAYDDFYASGPSSVYTLIWLDPQAVEEAAVPAEYSLSQNYPNPFNPATTIAFSLPLAGDIELAVYDLVGRRVALLAAGACPAGLHEVQFDAADLPSGLYFYQLRAGDYSCVKKMMVVK